MRKIILLLLSFMLVFNLCACNTTPTTPTEPTIGTTTYSVGLREDGYYIDYESLAPEYTYDLEVQEQDLQDYITSMLQADQNNNSLTFDDYLDMFANNLLSSMGLDKKEIVEPTDIVNVSLQFVDKEGKEVPEYTNTSNYTANEKGDSIVSSFIGHKTGDQYSVEYTFPEDDEYNPSETMTVNIVINDIFYADPLNSGVVEEHLTELNEVLVGVEDIASFKTALCPYVLAYHLQDYIEEFIVKQDVEVPSEWTEYEHQRLLSRLRALDLTYEQYLESAKLTEEDIAQMCEENARANMIALTIYNQRLEPITDEDLAAFYGEENLEYYTTLQGRPYLKLRVIRTLAFFELAKTTNIIDANGSPIDLSIFFGENETSTSDLTFEENEPAKTE